MLAYRRRTLNVYNQFTIKNQIDSIEFTIHSKINDENRLENVI